MPGAVDFPAFKKHSRKRHHKPYCRAYRHVGVINAAFNFYILLKADGFAVGKQYIIKLNADNRALVKNAAAVRFAYNTAELLSLSAQ